MGLLINVLITFLVIILVLYLVNMLPVDGRAKQIIRNNKITKLVPNTTAAPTTTTAAPAS